MSQPDQRRILKSSILGPRSIEFHEQRTREVAGGLGSILPIFIDRAGGGILVTEYTGFVEVAAALNRLTPGNHAKKTALFTTGAEAVENPAKIARTATGRQAVVVVGHVYRGRSLLTMTMTAKNVPYKQGFGPFAPEIYRVPSAKRRGSAGHSLDVPSGHKHVARVR